jgi:hypothetical protein
MPNAVVTLGSSSRIIARDCSITSSTPSKRLQAFGAGGKPEHWLSGTANEISDDGTGTVRRSSLRSAASAPAAAATKHRHQD